MGLVLLPARVEVMDEVVLHYWLLSVMLNKAQS